MQHINAALRSQSARSSAARTRRFQQYSTATDSPPTTPAAQQQPQQQRSAATSPLVDEFLRVDHAGELGADRIYAGQMAVLGRTAVGPTIQHMWDQEREHRREFERLIGAYRVRPTVMTPLWHVAGFALGAGTALLGEKAAMACTVAVETVIVEHYNDQLRQLMDEPKVDRVSVFFCVCCCGWGVMANGIYPHRNCWKR